MKAGPISNGGAAGASKGCENLVVVFRPNQSSFLRENPGFVPWISYIVPERPGKRVDELAQVHNGSAPQGRQGAPVGSGGIEFLPKKLNRKIIPERNMPQRFLET